VSIAVLVVFLGLTNDSKMVKVSFHFLYDVK